MFSSENKLEPMVVLMYLNSSICSLLDNVAGKKLEPTLVFSITGEAECKPEVYVGSYLK